MITEEGLYMAVISRGFLMACELRERFRVLDFDFERDFDREVRFFFLTGTFWSLKLDEVGY